jgi:hypothetical protein
MSGPVAERSHELVLPVDGHHVANDGEWLTYRMTTGELTVLIASLQARLLGLDGTSGLPVNGRG